MRLCVGAGSRRVVEEAAKRGVAQIVASRRQVGETSPGYTGYTSASLAETVAKLSEGATEVVRDHGGPYQNGDGHDNWLAALDADVAAGFTGLHLDVSLIGDQGAQLEELTRLCRRYEGRADIEVGGERDTQEWLHLLLGTALKACSPRAAVAQFGGHIWADRQYGALIPEGQAQAIEEIYGTHQVMVKAHNLDWAGGRQNYDVRGFYNVAPEFTNVEIDAWLRVLPRDEGQQILVFGHRSMAWTRWFALREGTWLERARAGLRYHLQSPPITKILSGHDDTLVREAISDAITHG